MVLLKEIIYSHPNHKTPIGETTCGIYQHNILLKSVTVSAKKKINLAIQVPIKTEHRVTIQLVHHTHKEQMRARELIIEPEQIIPGEIISDLNFSTKEELKIVLGQRSVMKKFHPVITGIIEPEE